MISYFNVLYRGATEKNDDLPVVGLKAVILLHRP
jgi:hypothetical protein